MSIQQAKSQSGFTLIELVIVIIISGILATMTTSVIELPIRAYVDQTRRATLTDAADTTMRALQRDIRSALPNSIRVSADKTTIEFLHTVDGGRYRAQLNNTTTPPSGDILDFDQQDNSMDVLGVLTHFANVTIGQDRLVIYPLNSSGSNPYQGDNTSLITGGNASHLTFTPFQFPLRSHDQRFFIIDHPITYRCDNTASTPDNQVLLKYTAYPIQATQPLPPPAGNSAIQANLVADCQFHYTSGSHTRSGVVTITLTLRDDAGESVHLIRQVRVDNQP